MPQASEELRGVEHFDRALQVTTPRAWLALLMLVALVSAAVTWAWLGRIATYVPAHGIVLSRGGTVHDVATRTAGTIVRVLPSFGDTVTAGDVVAVLHDVETVERHATRAGARRRTDARPPRTPGRKPARPTSLPSATSPGGG